MSYKKKYNSSTITRKIEKSRIPLSNVFSSECSAEVTPSPSLICLSSLTYNESCVTNYIYSQWPNMSLQDLKAKYDELLKKRNDLHTTLDQKIKLAIDLNKEEFTLTCKIPTDHKLLDPYDEVRFTKNPLPSFLLNLDNKSDYQSEKNRLLLQIETISNIIEVLRKIPKSEKKMKKELENKRKDIDEIKDKLNNLERGHVSDQGNLKHRSSSVGTLNLILAKPVELNFRNGNLSNNGNNHLEVKPNYIAPLTEPSQRKFTSTDTSQIPKSNWNLNTPLEISNTYTRSISANSHNRIRDLKQSPNGYSLHQHSLYKNNSNFQRFASVRTTIKRPLFLDKDRSNFNKLEKSDLFVETQSSSLSSTSRSSIDDGAGSDISDMKESIISRNEMEPLKNKFITLRQNSTVSCRSHNCRDSMELNHYRLHHTDSNYSQKILSRSNKQNRKSVSLEDLSEDLASVNVKYLARRDQKLIDESVFDPIRNQITYHPSIKYGIPNNLTRGKQPSIIRKEARNNSLVKKT